MIQKELILGLSLKTIKTNKSNKHVVNHPYLIDKTNKPRQVTRLIFSIEIIDLCSETKNHKTKNI